MRRAPSRVHWFGCFGWRHCQTTKQMTIIIVLLYYLLFLYNKEKLVFLYYAITAYLLANCFCRVIC